MLVPDPDGRFLPFPPTLEQERLLRALGASARPLAPLHYVEIDCAGADVSRLGRCLEPLNAHHDALRTVLRDDGQWQVLPEGGPVLRETDAPPARVRADLLDAPWERGGPAARMVLSRREDGAPILHAAFDALRLDGPSIHLLALHLRRLYQDAAAPEPLKVGFRDYVLWQRSLSVPEPAAAWWRQHAATLGTPPVWRGEHRAPDGAATGPGLRSMRLATAELPAIRARLAQAGITMSTALLMGLGRVMPRICAANGPMQIGATLFERRLVHPHVNEVAGNFTAITPLNLPAADRDLRSGARAAQALLLELGSRASTAGIPPDCLAVSAGAVLFTSALAGVTEGGLGEAHAASASSGPFDWLGSIVFERARRPDAVLDLQALEDRTGVVVNAYFDGAVLAADAVGGLLGELRADLLRGPEPVAP